MQVKNLTNLESKITRREFLQFTMISTACLAAGCAVNPVTGESQFILISEDTEIKIDKENSPYQFSADYGTIQDTLLNSYLDQTGKKMASKTHRPNMPYSFRGVNATYVNAYAFPGGTIAATRGILLSLENEAELAALLGHELGHVNARHTAQIMSKSMLTQAVIGGIAVYAGTKGETYGKVASALGMIGAGALLASYSRDNEREADDLGLKYMTQSGYNPDGFSGLMDMLRNMSKHKPNAIELMFSTHPMSDERYNTALEKIRTQYQADKTKPLYRERYMDHTAGLRKIKTAIESMQKGEQEMAASNYTSAEEHLKKALSLAPNDYAGLLMMSQCKMLMENYVQAEHFAVTAGQVFPEEAGSYYLDGLSKLKQKKYETSYNQFEKYEKALPGNPNTTFYKGYCLEQMERIENAAQEYQKYLTVVNQGENAQHAYNRLVEWGYIKKQE